jgi:putative toxin-antitoxin system antitoxin component (TIGR02293 family)
VRRKEKARKVYGREEEEARRKEEARKVYGREEEVRKVDDPETGIMARMGLARASEAVASGVVVLGGARNKPEGQMTSLEKMDMADRGVTKRELESLKGLSGLDYDELANALSVGRATLINKKGGEKFSPVISEKIVGLADLYSYGYEIFGEKERFNRWMVTPIRALGWKAPYDLIHNQFGLEEVRHLIGRIAYGVFS